MSSGPDRWRRVEEICHAALELTGGERETFLASACADTPALRAEVDRLLAQTQKAERFLASPIDQIAARVLEGGLSMQIPVADRASAMIGRIVTHYRIVEHLGGGGMGVVYRADDVKLGRSSALKFLPPDVTRDPGAKRRFMIEAQAASALDHPNIGTIYEIDESSDGELFIAMAYYAGETLKAKIERGPLKPHEALDYAIQIAQGLIKAHAAGIVHRDIKPANVLVTSDGLVKIVDFGVAKLLGTTTLTRTGATLGTLAYMSPEQLLGKDVDARSDIWSLGVVLCEMLTGERPFSGTSTIAVSDAILHERPRDFGDALTPGRLRSVILRLLEKDRSRRPTSAQEVERELKTLEASLTPTESTRISRVAWVVMAVATILIVVSTTWVWRRSTRERWALQTAGPEIVRLIDTGDYTKAAALTREALAVLPHDPRLEQLWKQATGEVSITTVPLEADVSIRAYDGSLSTWRSLGKTPLNKLSVPVNEFIWRIAKPGFAPIVFITDPPLTRNLKLQQEEIVPPGMVVVNGGQSVLDWPFGRAAVETIDDFLIDEHEVTNEEYKKFVDAGGYQKPEFWTEPFVRDGRTLSWGQAVGMFRDATGRPGPPAWLVGSFPKGMGKHPVAGVSWYEAAAYAQFAGKSLPTVYHWRRAAQTDEATLIVPGSNFSDKGTVPVGNEGALSGFGTTDMAGNVKEWCLNESSQGKRFILGGGFGEANYMFTFMDAVSPWERRPNFGFRCVKLLSPRSATASAKLEHVARDVWKDQIASDEAFAAFKGLYTYDRTDLHARVEETQASDAWVREKVTFDAAYGNERVIAHLFLPKNLALPFETVIYFPGAEAVLVDRFLERLNTGSRMGPDRDFIVNSGRAFVIPIFKGTFERRDGLKAGGPGGNQPGLWRDHVIMWSKDLGRTLDYLQTRSDIDSNKVAYFGFSFGTGAAPVLWAMEPRIKAAVLTSGGFWFQRGLPEVDGTNFVTRVHIPVLMLNGRYDSNFPVESAQLPLFRRLGTVDKDKRHVLYEGGHGTLPHGEEVRETLNWLDKYWARPDDSATLRGFVRLSKLWLLAELEGTLVGSGSDRWRRVEEIYHATLELNGGERGTFLT